jgi:two-component system, OmpR family, response regulator
MTRGELRRILYVEDEKDIQTVIRLSLERLGGFELLVCDSGREAVEKAPAFAPDLILMDVMMPGMDGPATVSALKRLDGLAQTPFLFITAKVQTQEVNRLRELGAIDVISKPFDAMTLPQKLRDIWAKIDG